VPTAKKRQRNHKGGVSIGSRSGMIRLRWTHEGKNYDRSPGLRDIPLNRHTSRTIAALIERDIALGQFDRTCDKYFPKHKSAPPARQLNTKDQWERWMAKHEGEGVTLQTLSNRYQTIFNLLVHFDRDILTPEDARDFMTMLYSRQVPSTSNRNLKMMNAFYCWVIEQGWIIDNPFLDIKPLKDSGPKSRHQAPFTLDELRKILETFRTDPRYSHYHDFTRTLAMLGLRPSEAIGLRWEHIDFSRETVTISGSLSRSGQGDRRIQKGRKNGEITVLPLDDTLLTLFKARFTLNSKPDDLIFRTPTGKVISDHNFSQRIWKAVLEQAEIPHRSPYNLRHSFASHALEQGIDAPTVSYTMGHRDTTMVMKVYGHMVNRPKLPKLGF
jgi:integrase